MSARKRPNPTSSPLMLEIMAALGEIEVIERFIPGDRPGHIVYGEYRYPKGPIIINPVPAIVDTVLHEAIHAVRGEWGENVVAQQTARLFNRLSEAQQRAIYAVYRKKVEA